ATGGVARSAAQPAAGPAAGPQARLAAGPRGDVELDRDRSLEPGGRLLGGLAADVCDRDPGAFLGEAARRRLPDPGAGAGDERNLAREAAAFEREPDHGACRPLLATGLSELRGGQGVPWRARGGLRVARRARRRSRALGGGGQ